MQLIECLKQLFFELPIQKNFKFIKLEIILP